MRKISALMLMVALSVFACAATHAEDTQYQGKERDENPLKKSGTVEGHVIDTTTGSLLTNARVQALCGQKMNEFDGESETCDIPQNGSYKVKAPMGSQTSRLDWRRAVSTSIVGAVASLFGGGLREETQTVMVDGYAVHIEAPGYKPFHGFVDFLHINGDSMSAIARTVCLAPETSEGVSHIAADDQEPKLEILPEPQAAAPSSEMVIKVCFTRPVAWTSDTLKATVHNTFDEFNSLEFDLKDNGKGCDTTKGDGIYTWHKKIPDLNRSTS